MADATVQMLVDFDAQTADKKEIIFRANGSVITFPGFLAAYDYIAKSAMGFTAQYSLETSVKILFGST
jgi:hypothetical protein